MKYKEQLRLISENIYNLGKDLSPQLKPLLTQKTESNLRVYQRNLLGVLEKSLSQDFPAIQLYLGSNNFMYFTRLFLLKKKISSPNIQECSKYFQHFLEECYDIHEDDFIAPLAQLDLFWASALESGESCISLPKGLTKYWSALQNSSDCSTIEVDFNEDETVCLRWEGGELVLVLKVK